MPSTSVLVQGVDGPGLLAACRDALGDVRGRYDLGILYLTDSVARDAGGIVEGLTEHTGVRRWGGGVALGVCGREGVVFGRPALALLLLSLPADSFRVFGPARAVPDTGADRDLAAWMASHAPNVALVHADPRAPDVPALLHELGRERYLVGGLLSSRGGYPHVAARVAEGAISGVLLDDGVPVVVRVSQGCTPIGPRRTVTSARGPMLHELDSMPAVEALAEDLRAAGPGVNPGNVHVALPLEGSDTGDYVVRNLLGIDHGRTALVVGDELSPGGSLMFCVRDADSARADLERMLDRLAAALPGPPRAGIYVSCLARGPNLFDEPGLEVGCIRSRLGDFPLVGFFANGEIACDRLYAYTGVLTLLV